MHSRAAELAVIEHFLATHGVTRCPVAFAAPVAGVLSPAQEAERIASLPVEKQLTRAQVFGPFLKTMRLVATATRVVSAGHPAVRKLRAGPNVARCQTGLWRPDDDGSLTPRHEIEDL
jgi:hypothetical protein